MLGLHAGSFGQSENRKAHRRNRQIGRGNGKRPAAGGKHAAGLAGDHRRMGGTLSVGLVLIVTKTTMPLQRILVI